VKRNKGAAGEKERQENELKELGGASWRRERLDKFRAKLVV
jgi:hypothetical protein